jgi:magnesium chelatase family protein
MLAKVRSCAVVGMEGVIVEVEVDVSPGLPFFGVVGLPDAAVQEARERVRAAVRNSGFTFPMRRVVAALALANLKKAGPAYDLPIAVALLIATEQAPAEADGLILLGELGLDGTMRHTPGILPMVAASHEKGFSRFISSVYWISPACPGLALPGNPFGIFAVSLGLDKDGQFLDYFQVELQFRKSFGLKLG